MAQSTNSLEESWNRLAYAVPTTMAPQSGAVTVDCSPDQGSIKRRMTLNGDVTSWTINNLPDGGEVILEFIHDGTDRAMADPSFANTPPFTTLTAALSGAEWVIKNVAGTMRFVNGG